MNVSTRQPLCAVPKRTIWTLFILLSLLLPVPSFAAQAPLLLEVKNILTSYYGTRHDGSKTANGQRHDSEGLMAAHLSLPFGTILRVTNLQNGRDVLVRINDRGPFSKRLGLDVSQAAARELNMVRAGVVRVQTEVVGDSKGRPILPGSGFYVDLATLNKADAAREKDKIATFNEVRHKAKLTKGPEVRVLTKAMPDGKGRRFVGMGPFASFREAETAYKSMKKYWPRARVVCATMAKGDVRLVTSVIADDVPKVVAEYKGKQKPSKQVASSSRKSSSKVKASSSQRASSKATTSSTKKSESKVSPSKSSRKKSGAVKSRSSSEKKSSGRVSSSKRQSSKSKATVASSKTTSKKATSQRSSSKSKASSKASSKQATAAQR